MRFMIEAVRGGLRRRMDDRSLTLHELHEDAAVVHDLVAAP